MSDTMRAVLLAAVLAVGCSTGPLQVSSTPLSGVVGGVAWTFASAETNDFLSSSDQFFVEVYAESVAPCTGAGNQVHGNRLIMNVPRSTGDYLLGSGLNETFFVESTGFNYIATEGRVVVNKVTDTTVSAGAHFLFDGNNSVDGQFQAQICPP